MALKESDLDTIAAIATAPGEGAIGIVRLSGKNAITIAGRIFRPQSGGPVAGQKNFMARYGHVISRAYEGNAGQIVDEALLLVMRSPRTYTSEDMAEIQVHGGAVVLQETLALAVREGARPAGPGEFTQRAFLNGRMDLLQAEAVLDLIQAKTEKTRRWASAQLEGALSKKMTEMKSSLVEILSRLEASIDFPDDDLDTGDRSMIEKKIRGLAQKIESLLHGSDTAILAKRGARAVFWGRPNTGKSSLMNQLARQNRVIVTPVPGTTRDVVEEEIQIHGIPLRILDTAGIQDTGDLIEAEGVSRARKAVATADLILFVLDASQSLTAEDKNLYQEIQDRPKIVILNKSDLPQKINRVELNAWNASLPMVSTSCETGDGISMLEREIVNRVAGSQAETDDEVLVNSIRQKEALIQMKAALENAFEACRAGLSSELVAVDIRLALNELGMLVGEIVTDDILDALFSRFCIGK